MKKNRSALALLGLGIPFVVFPSVARAVTCDALPNAANPTAGSSPPVVYVEGSTAAAPFVVQLQQALSVDASPINVVYVGDGSCVAMSNFLTNSPIGSKPKPTYYSGNVAGSCDLPTNSPLADIAVSDVFAASCGALPSGQLPASVGDFLGPVQPMVIAVPKASTQRSISAAAAYFVFGFGSGSGVLPWTANGSIYRRNSGSGTQAMISVAVGVPPTQWAGVDASTLPANVMQSITGTPAVIHSLVTDSNPEQAIGILSATSLDATTASHLSVLAYKDVGQSCGYYPDSTSTAHDKANVRDGHYSLWGPIHFLTFVDAHNVPQNHSVARIIAYLTGSAVFPGGSNLVEISGLNNLVPPCAMRVARTVEMGPLTSSKAQASCGCYYDLVATGQSSCQRCTKRSDCPARAPVCNLAYPASFCEAL